MKPWSSQVIRLEEICLICVITIYLGKFPFLFQTYNCFEPQKFSLDLLNLQVISSSSCKLCSILFVAFPDILEGT